MLTEIVNHLWQSTLVAAAIAALMALLRDHGAHVRYWLWWAASVKFLVPFSLLASLGTLVRTDAPLVDLADLPATLSVIAEPMPAANAWTPLALVLLGVWPVGFAAVIGRWMSRAFNVRTLLQTSVPYAGPLPPIAAGPEVRTSGRARRACPRRSIPACAAAAATVSPSICRVRNSTPSSPMSSRTGGAATT